MENAGATEQELMENRIEKASELRKLGISPYPSKSKRKYSAAKIHEIASEFIASNQEIAVGGRIMARRGHGKMSFIDIFDESGKIQAVFKSDELGDKFEQLSFVDIGDFLEVTGVVFMTKSGEISILAKDFAILTKAIRPLPSTWYGLHDEEQRMRRRYLDMILNPEVKEVLYKKAKFWNSMRKFLVDKGFLEVETPVLEVTCGGADATPFVTHHNALDIDLYLRISMGELWQKRLLVGGFEKTFEIGRQFRNEGISREHLQDYTQMEFYLAYANYEDSMELVEEMYKYVAKETFGTTKFTIGGREIELDCEWGRIDYVDTIVENLGIDVLSVSDEEIREKVKELHLEHKKSDTRGRMIDTLWKSIRGKIDGPVFLINHPVCVSPLAKRHEENSEKVERYQVIIAGSEIGNGYSELNDPIDQKERFLEQAKMREDGDSEAQMNDDDFVRALEYGMPPATGFGTSERMFSFLLDKPIRECVAFPLVKPEQNDKQTNNK